MASYLELTNVCRTKITAWEERESQELGEDFGESTGVWKMNKSLVEKLFILVNGAC